MDTQVIWLSVGLTLFLLGVIAYILIKRRNYESFVQKCKNIVAPEGSTFYFSGIKNERKGATVRGFIATTPSEGGPSVEFFIDNPRKLGNNLHISLNNGGYLLRDSDNRVYF